MAEQWAGADKYERYVGRWSRRIASEFIDWLAMPDGLRWVDVGCGTGALSEAVRSRARPSTIIGMDRSPPFLRAVAQAHPRQHLLAADAQHLPLRAASCDVVVSGLALNFFSEPQQALHEFWSCLAEGGIMAVYVWDYGEGMEMMRHFWDAAVELDDAARELDEGRRFPICAPTPLRGAFEDAGLRRVDVRPIDIETEFRDFDDFWEPFLWAGGSAPAYAMSLPGDRRHALRERLHAGLPIRPDGSIRLKARAWAVRGQR